MANRLSHENSPYLLQHADNPVDWFPWGDDALNRAKAEDRPIFLSVGYSACHWCHVMAHESFEDPAIAARLNAEFVCVKVDREERPEIDHLYMEAVQMMTGHGGWPLSVFLTPALEPFFGGTYWPARSRRGMAGFDQVIEAVARAWREQRKEIVEQGRQLAEMLKQELPPPRRGGLSDRPLREAAAALVRSFDRRWGGFGKAPKFPQAVALMALLRWHKRSGEPAALEAVRVTLDRMADGGMYDHLGGGFHRYSVDERWLVPHFEKMLYDNALLAAVYLEAWQATGAPRYEAVVRETLDYLLRDMTDAAGGFHSAEDADSEGEEGRFYLWTPAEIEAALGRECAERFCRFYDVTAAGNFEGRNILNRSKTVAQMAEIAGVGSDRLAAELDDARGRLRAVRDRRVRPGRDDKVLVSWNALAIDALARAGAVLAEPRYLEAAARAADFLLAEARQGDRLLHYWRRGRAGVAAFLDDYAGLANALLSLYEARFEPRWLAAALELGEQIGRRFSDRKGGGFFFGQADDGLPARRKEVFDGSIPSASGLAATVLARLGKMLGRSDLIDLALHSIEAAMPWIERGPSGCGQLLLAIDFLLGPTPELVLVPGDPAETADVLRALRRRFVPNCVVALADDAARAAVDEGSPLAGLLEGKTALHPGPTLYVCEDHTCQAPVVGAAAVLDAIGRL